LDWQTLPARIDGIIGERLDRVPTDLRATLKVASVEGESFTAEVTACVREKDTLDMIQQLSTELDRRHRLVSGQGCRRIGPSGQRLSCYQFRHILFQRYLYRNLDDAERSYLHEAVGYSLEASYEEYHDEIAVQLARHFRAAGVIPKAIAYLSLAGERARRLSANEEAIGHFAEALELLKMLPESPENARNELTVQLALAVTLTAAKGYAAPEVDRAYVRARELCRQMDKGQVRQTISEVREFPELMGLSVYVVGGRLQSARSLAEQALRSAQNQDDEAFQLQCHFSLGHTLFHLGKLKPARAHLDRCLQLYSPEHPTNSAFHLQNPKVTSLSYSAWCLWHLGYPNQAMEKSHLALSLAQQLSQPYSLAYALNWAARLYLFRREWLAVLKQAETAISVSTEHGFTIMSAFGTMLRGAALVGQGEFNDGILYLRDGLATHQSTGAEIAVPYFLAPLAEAYAKENRLKQALGLLSDAQAAMARTGERFGEAELFRLRGELLLNATSKTTRQGVSRELSPEEYFLTAVEIAHRQQAKSLELRAVMSLAQLRHRQGKVDEAHQMLSATVNWFSEGFNTPDLRAARALLATFGGPQTIVPD
jgi:predicted ATPase